MLMRCQRWNSTVRSAILPWWAGARTRALLLCTLAIGMLAAVLDVQPAAASDAVLQVDVPTQVDIGEPFAIRLSAPNAPPVAGYEMVAHFDSTVAHVRGIEHMASRIEAPGAAVQPLGMVELPDGVAFGAYTCLADNCTHTRQLSRRPGERANLRALATLTVVASRPGALEIQLASAIFVGAGGQKLPIAGSNPTLTVQVGPASAKRHYPAPATPAARASWPAPAGKRLPSFDLNADMRINRPDMVEAALRWALAREYGAPCDAAGYARFDVNADGCIDIADVQSVATHLAAASTHASGLAEPGVAGNMGHAASGAGFIVDTTADDGDTTVGDAICATARGKCSLRAAISEANAHAGPDAIGFNIPGRGVQTIRLSSALPALSDTTGPTTLDGYTQPGASRNSKLLISNARIMVQLEGSGAENFIGLALTSPGNVVRGLALYRLKHALMIYGSDAHDNLVAGNFIGTDAGGSYAAPLQLFANGIVLAQGAARNRIGGPDPAARNVVSGNAFHGIALFDAGTDANVIHNNIVGLAPSGDRRIPNARHGIDINQAASHNIVGGTGPGERNVISGNGWAGVEISHGQNTANNRVLGNYIGTDLSGTQALPLSANARQGIILEDGVRDNIVANNVIGNNRTGGISVAGASTSGNRLFDNQIGVSPIGSAIPNGNFGVQVANQAVRTVIGPNNTIANHPVGVEIIGDATDFNTVSRNAIFDNAELGIDLDPNGVSLNDQYPHDGPNQRLNFPLLTWATPAQISGTACAGCAVELFVADRPADRYGQGKLFVGAATAGADGTFSVSVSGLQRGDYVTATATDAMGNSSEFSRTRRVGEYVHLPLIAR